MEKDLRLIANITIDEEQKVITIDKDMNQKPFALKECYVFAKVVGTSSSDNATYKQCRIGYNSIQNIPLTAMCNTLPEGNNAYLISHAIVLPGYLFRQDEIHKWNFGSSINNLAGNSMYKMDFQWSDISSIVVNPGNNAYFGVGSTIEVYGR